METFIDLRDGLVTSHEDLRIVLIQSTLVVTNGRHILDDNCVVRVFTLLVKHRVGFNHVIDNIGLGNFLGTELSLGAKVLSIIVAKVIVACNGSELDAGTDQEIDEGRLHLCLAGLEVITTNECIVLLSKLNATWNKSVLRRTIDERSILENRSDSKDGGWCNLFMTILNGLHEIVCSIIDARNEVRETLSVGCPLDNDLLQSMFGLEIPDQ
jgi:hypothetical protein